MTFSTKYLSAHAVHYVWDNALLPAIEVGPGETFTVALRDASDRQL